MPGTRRRGEHTGRKAGTCRLVYAKSAKPPQVACCCVSYTAAAALFSLFSPPAKLLRLRCCEVLIGEALCHLPNMHSAAQRPALAYLKLEQRQVAALE